MFQTPAPRLIAHRGFTAQYPENSLPAFSAAGKAGYWAIETDVHLTSDGALVCNHDDRVDSRYEGSGCIRNMSLPSLRRLDLQNKHRPAGLSSNRCRMPVFTEYLEICRQYHAVPFIECKCDAIPVILETACRLFAETEIIISSTSLEHLKKTRSLSDRVFLHHIFSNPAAIRQLSVLGHSGASLNCPDPGVLPKQVVTAIHSIGVRLCLRAGDTPEAIRQMMALQLDYIPTNHILPSDTEYVL